MNFVSIPTVYEEKNEDICVATSPSMTPTTKHISVKHHLFRQHVGKEFVIQKSDSENQKAYIFTKGL